MSISVGLMAVVAIWDISGKSDSTIRERFHQIRSVYILLAAWLLLILIDGYHVGFSTDWVNEFLLKLPVVIVPVYLIALSRESRFYELTWLLFVSVNSVVALISGVNYILNYEEINELLLQSKHIPIIGNSHHIYFGVISALSIWLCYGHIKKSNYRLFWRINMAVLLVMMHILASRTGLLGFYLSVVVFLIFEALRSKRYRSLLIGLGVIIVLPVVGYTVSTSFHNKVENSLEDMNAVISGEDINFKSLAMRVEAWKTSYHLLQENLWFGVGLTQVEQALQEQYVKDRTVLYPENRIGPHNQFLEIGLAHGVAGVLILILVFISLFRQPGINALYVALVTVFLITFFLESFLERQQGIIAFCLFCFGTGALQGRNAKETQN